MSAAPIPRACWDITITASVNDRIRVRDANSVYTTPILITIAAGTYATPEALATAVAAAIQAALRADGGATTTETCVSAVSVAGKITFAFGSLAGGSSLLWSFGTVYNALATLLGFDANVTQNGTAVTNQPYWQVQNFWTPGLPVRSDPRERSTYPRSVVETTGNQVVTVDLVSTALTRRTIAFEHLAASKTLISQETTGNGGTTNQALERLFVATTGGYAKFRWYDDATDLSTYSTYALRQNCAQAFVATRMYDSLEIYSTTLEMTATS